MKTSVLRPSTAQKLSLLLYKRYSSSGQVRPFEEIPTPPGGWIPYLGHASLLAKKPHGQRRSWKNVLELKNKYVSEEVGLLRLKLPVLNPAGNGRVLQVFDPEESQLVYRNEGKYPNRGDFFGLFRSLRQTRPELFGETFGILIEDGENWHKVRSKVQQDMMRPKSAMFYYDKLDVVGDEFVDFIKRKRSPDGCVENFLSLAHQFASESITLIALDTRMGCFEPQMSPDLKEYLEGLEFVMKKTPDLMFGFPTWKIFPPRWTPLFRTIEEKFHVIVDFVKLKIDAAIREIQKNPKSVDEMSVLEKLILKNGPDSVVPFVMAFDMVLAGIDTTGNTLSFLLYHLARHPDKQEKLREEIRSFGRQKLSPRDLGHMPYFRACLQENFRLLPTAPVMARVLPQDTIIKGYNVPAGTMVMWYHKIIGSLPQYFPEPDRYIPERWMTDKNKINPFSVRNFSHGPRMCIGKRFAELEIQLAAYKLIQNFSVEWTPSYELDPLEELVLTPDKSMDFRFTDL